MLKLKEKSETMRFKRETAQYLVHRNKNDYDRDYGGIVKSDCFKRFSGKTQFITALGDKSCCTVVILVTTSRNID